MVVTRARCFGLVVLLFFGVSTRSVAAAPEADPFDGRLLPVEIVMAFRKQIALTEEQNAKIGALVVELQQGIAGKQWKMQTAYFDLIEVLDQERLDEQRAIDLAKQAIDSENEIKLEQLRLLIRMRNLLTNDQVAFLRKQLADGWTKE